MKPPVSNVDGIWTVAYQGKGRAELRELGESLVEAASNEPGCVCKGHVHAGGAGGCYFGGTLVPRCKCTWVGE